MPQAGWQAEAQALAFQQQELLVRCQVGHARACQACNRGFPIECGLC